MARKKYVLSEKTLAKNDEDFASFLHGKDKGTQDRYIREKERYNREHGIRHQERPRATPRPSGEGLAGGNRRYLIVFEVHHRNGNKSFHTITKNSPLVSDSDRERVISGAEDRYPNQAILSAAPTMTVDQRTGNKVLISGPDFERY